MKTSYFSKVWIIFLMAMVAPASASAEDGITYFLIGPRFFFATNSFVVPLKDPADIAQAREQLNVPYEERRQISAQVGAGPDWINRNYIEPGHRLWHWHIVRYHGFADGGGADDEGHPRGIENDVEGFIVNTFGGHARFPFVFAREMTKEEIFAAIPRLTAEGMQIAWADLGTNYVYTVEISESIPPGSWSPAPGATWPLTGTNWVDTSVQSSNTRTYRVRAELAPPP